MATGQNEDKSMEFWLALLKFGASEEERQRNWNIYCAWKIVPSYEVNFPREDWEKFLERTGTTGGYSQEEVGRLDEFAHDQGGHPPAVNRPSICSRPLMDFAGRDFPEGVSFQGRGLFSADFSKAIFGRHAYFHNTMFVGGAKFTAAEFLSDGPELQCEAIFIGSSFHGDALFHDVQFPDTTRFDQAAFHGSAKFSRATFMSRIGKSGLPDGSAAFRKAKFKRDVNFNDSVFGVGAKFENANFDSNTSFDNTKFESSARFNNAVFGNTTSFRGASFRKPPKFFETDIHEDVNFNRIVWSGAEQSYSRRNRRNDEPDRIVEDAEDAIRAWDRLALITGEQEKLTERHEFYRLMMRAQRQRDGYRSLSSIANWLFDKSSDYGWGIGCAFSWWAGHIVIGAVLLTIATKCPLMVWDGLLVSFANSLAFLRLGSEDGYLNGSHKALEGASSHSDWVFSTVGTTQAVLGPVLLFLVLLTLRNRFRLG